MKRRQRRQVLDINSEQSDSPRRRWQNDCDKEYSISPSVSPIVRINDDSTLLRSDKYEQIAADHSEDNGGPSNPLTNLLEQYNSDSETEDPKPEGKQLDDKVNDFLKEIQLIAPKPPGVENTRSKTSSSPEEPRESSSVVPSNESSTLWQECFDDSTGYPYYWHVHTNEVTWEVPEEIRLLRERNEQDSLNRTSYSTQWVNFSSNTYPQPQINIPEGMIPKEVVARNRNRQVSSRQNSQRGCPTERNTFKNSMAKDEESDDGKIEMITSFGSDGSESETSDTDSPLKKSSKESQSTKIHSRAKTTIEASKNSTATMKKTEIGEKIGKMGPSLPAGIVPLIHGPENSTKIEVEREKWEKNEGEERAPRDEQSSKQSQKLELSVKNSTEASTSCGSKKLISQTKGKSEEVRDVVNSVKELKFSLVPGYADDSDIEDDSTPKKSNVEPLFPIADFPVNSASTIVTQDGTVKKIETKYTDSGSVKIFQYHNAINDKTENQNEEIKQMNDELESEVRETTSIEETRVVRIEDETPKPNIFLENLETPSKAFQRKRRIAFDVIPSKNRTSESESVSKPESVPSPPAALSANEMDRHGLGFPKESRNNPENEETADTWDGKTNSAIPEKPIVAGKGTMSFVKGETIVAKTEETVKEKTPEEINELKRVTGTIMEKLRFLSEGGQPASAVQVMAIQLQTLLAAWEARELKDNYLENWLTGTGRELGRLEEAAAPPGWDCQWDRSHKRYFYRNSMTGDAQWTYPEADVIGGTEEMELCTTPPPQGQEEPCIIESQTEKFQEVSSTLTETERLNEESFEVNNLIKSEAKEVTVPPPPHISSPSPPPPPRIYAEDMKKGKKRRGSIQGTIPETKRDKFSPEANGDDTLKSRETVNPPLPPSPTKSVQPPLPPHPPIVPNPPNSEPLPPGVDPPDMPFTINAPPIETTMLYTPAGPQTNPIYAATISDPTILSHHTALMQAGQLMHYPTYHQHLHNQALIAAANRLSGQEAVQFMVDYSQVYANTRVIAKPPIKSHKETLGSAIDSFYSDIASIEQIRNDHEPEQLLPVEPLAVTRISEIPLEAEQPPILTDSVLKERKKKKTKLGISKKQKEVSSMVAKWQKAQHYEDND